MQYIYATIIKSDFMVIKGHHMLYLKYMFQLIRLKQVQNLTSYWDLHWQRHWKYQCNDSSLKSVFNVLGKIWWWFQGSAHFPSSSSWSRSWWTPRWPPSTMTSWRPRSSAESCSTNTSSVGHHHCVSAIILSWLDTYFFSFIHIHISFHCNLFLWRLCILHDGSTYHYWSMSCPNHQYKYLVPWA